jgi:PIN domain nuclease of toxin-antitoxin system
VLDDAELFASPMVRLELSFLHEMGRIGVPASAVLGALASDIGLRLEESGWVRAAEVAELLCWTRDPFDRLIAAHAICFGAPLCTRDATIRQNYRQAFWN